jgi:hypothetical protein
MGVAMCLQWCHNRRLLIDNDLPCSDCTRFPAFLLPQEERCQSCQHRREQDGKPAFCSLSQMPLPKAGRCCHWNVEVDTRSEITLTTADVASDLLAIWDVDSVAELFARSETAPDYEQEGSESVRVNLDDLALPFVYGVPAAHWEAALDEPAIVQGNGVPSELGHAVLALLEADQQNELEYKQARAGLETLLVQHPLESLPMAWQELVASALELTQRS